MRRPHHDLVVWKDAVSLVLEVYRFTSSFPRDETYGITSQLRRAAVSVPSNIAEGAARNSEKEFLRALYIARGSLSELETQILISRELGFLADAENVLARVERVFALIAGLVASLQKRAS